MFRTKTIAQLFLVAVFAMASYSCMTTNVIANQQTSSLDHESCQELSHYKYWWGLGKSDEIIVGTVASETKCPCINNSLASVAVESNFGDFLLNFITLGIVNHRTVSYKCSEVDEGEQEN